MHIQTKLILPNNTKKLLLHSCCAPCSSAIIIVLLESNIDFTIFFYNPNIYPKEEYELRKNENIRFANKYNIPFIVADTDFDKWPLETKEFAKEPERGKRCSICFKLRLEKTAKYCNQNNFDIFTSSLGISRHKDLNTINNCGIEIASKYKNLTYWDCNWRKICDPKFMKKISEQENFYRQKYCGCIYSLPKVF